MYGQYPYNSTYQNPYFQQQNNYQSQQRFISQPMSNIEYVNGIEGAKATPVAPNSIKLLMDSEIKQFYIKRTDLEGRATIEVHPFTDLDLSQKPVETQASFVTVQQFNELKSELEQLKHRLEVTPDAKPNANAANV